jgi:RimJ/RimL family protein N-acetyltransferase
VARVTGAAETVEWPGELTDGIVLIRPYAPADAPAEVQAHADDATLALMLGMDKAPTVDELVTTTRTGTYPDRTPTLSIADATTDDFLGGIGLDRVDWRHRRGEVGFWITPAARGRGLAKRAIRLIAGWAFDELGLKRMELTTTPENAATRGLALRLGFREEGTMRQRNLERGRRVDVMMFAVLKDEWRG